MGTSGFGIPTLDALVRKGNEVITVYTKPSAVAGRGHRLQRSAIHDHAISLGLQVRSPTNLKDPEEQSFFSALAPDVAIVVSYGLILPQVILDVPVHGCLNLHASILPRWRGASPIQRAIMHGDVETGVSVLKMDTGLDTGPVVMEKKVRIAKDETAGQLHDRLAELGSVLITDILGSVPATGLVCRDQLSQGVTYASKIKKSETIIDWNRPAREVNNFINGLSPSPGAWCRIFPDRDEEAFWLKVLHSTEVSGSELGSALECMKGMKGMYSTERTRSECLPGEVLDANLTVACKEGAVRLLKVQREGKKVLSADQFLKGAPIRTGSKVA